LKWQRKTLNFKKMQTVKLDEREFSVFQLLDSIQRMEKAINFHSESNSPDQMAIEQYTELRERYQTELAETLRTFGINFILPQVAA
jgi:molecular chaperone GrpE (heat shock protein)